MPGLLFWQSIKKKGTVYFANRMWLLTVFLFQFGELFLFACLSWQEFDASFPKGCWRREENVFVGRQSVEESDYHSIRTDEEAKMCIHENNKKKMGTLKTPWRYWLVPQNKKKKKRNTSSLIQSFCQGKLLGIFCVCACVCVTLCHVFFSLSHFWLWLASFPPHDFARLRWCCNNPYYILYIIKWLSRPFFFFSYIVIRIFGCIIFFL